ncbi:Arc family DNA-binding protein [Pseudochrobactrum asaccharolyticum]|uniref:Arc family DNA-binding protein n=1 Tax=Pseudochrobactrum asaccharolyticum TaxID=354351 RepID=UPI001F00E98F|nr:Arc family DNA-binding protein [Pseudochrobactrum asaccharolyticum]MCF7647313.1 Arc family DNA-binding protein [Pseudochrobactrum asaccharolyticum]
MAPKLQVRFPPELKEFIELEAKKNSSSQNSEIIRCIRERMERVGFKTIKAEAHCNA